MSVDLLKVAAELEQVIQWEHIDKKRMGAVSLGSMRAMIRTLKEGAARSELGRWAEVEKAKADAYEAAATLVEEMSHPPEGQERWHGTDNEWAAIKLEDAAKAIRERKAKVCQVTQVAQQGER